MTVTRQTPDGIPIQVLLVLSQHAAALVGGQRGESIDVTGKRLRHTSQGC